VLRPRLSKREKTVLSVHYKFSHQQSDGRHRRLKCDKIFECTLRYRIEAAWMKGMTSQQTPESKVGALDNAVLVNRQAGILRTTRIKSAGRPQHRRYDQLVAPNQCQHDKLTDFTPPYQHVGEYFRKVAPEMSPPHHSKDWLHFFWQ
jgi:hypothetical protein